ncbi:TetR/AcrR family transcriptional regulator [Amycolatopsis sp.]|uniref:TetR/AcrR family transcriptional regulator n=1 Tax=Amycolatopsis sp. TaxID=37632 RepID=UPI002CD0E420|nr:TetR/AcrR family transcriptional regulator [Amycolatopsis sp.]HVV08233.1 TetR/AcrR family transcriptional regulator [Amycolatopsis sp.]
MNGDLAADANRGTVAAQENRRPVLDSGRLPVRRRAPYPVSPAIGPEGTRACLEMIEAGHRLFTERGYHGTTTTAIAEATGRSDAAFYQYFDSKQALFLLLFENLGRDLVAHFDTLPPVTGSRAGLAALHRWLTGLGVVLNRHSASFLEWPTPDEDDQAPAENPQEAYIARLGGTVRERLADADFAGLSSRTVSLVVTALTAYSHFVLDVRNRGSRAEATAPVILDDVLSRVIHRSLFPAAYPARAPGRLGRPGAARTNTAPERLPGLRRPVTRRGHATVRKISKAAIAAFEARGLAGTSVNDIIAAAGVAHGTFYTYWADRAAIVTTLMHQAAEAVLAHLGSLLAVGSATGLRGWLSGWLDVVAEHGPVLHVWATDIVDEPLLQPLGIEVDNRLRDVGNRLLADSSALGGLDENARATVLWTILAELPRSAWRRNPVLTRDEVLQAQILLLARGFLGWPL